MVKTHYSLIVIINKGNEVVTHVIDSDKVIIGRAIDATLPVSDPSISRHHMVISVLNGCMYLQDNESANGTFLNSDPLPSNQEIEIVESDLISIGNSKITMRFMLAEKVMDRSKSSGFKIGFGSTPEKEAQKIISEAEAEAHRLIQHGQTLVALTDQAHQQRIQDELMQLEKKKIEQMQEAKLEANRYLSEAEDQAKHLLEQKKEDIKRYYADKLADIHAQVGVEKNKMLLEAQKEKEKIEHMASQVLKQAHEEASAILVTADHKVSEAVSNYLQEAKKQNAIDRENYWSELQLRFKTEYSDEIKNFEATKSQNEKTLAQYQTQIHESKKHLQQIESMIQERNAENEENLAIASDLEIKKNSHSIIIRKQESDIRENQKILLDLESSLGIAKKEYETVDKLLEDRRLEIERSLELIEKHNKSAEEANQQKMRAIEELSQTESKLKMIKQEYLDKSREIEEKLAVERKQLTRAFELFRDKINKEREAISAQFSLENQNLQDEKNTLLERRSQLQEEVDNLSLDLDQVNEALEVSRREKMQLELEIELSSKVMKELTEVSKRVTSENEILASQQTELNQRLNELKAQVETLEISFKEKSERESRLNEQLKSFEDRKQTLEADVLGLESERETFAQEVKDLRDQFQLFQNQVSQKRGELDSLVAQHQQQSFDTKDKLDREFEKQQFELKKRLEAKEHAELKRINKLVDEKMAEFDTRRESIAKSLHYQIDTLLVSKFDPSSFKEVSEKLKVTIESILVEKSAGESIEQLNDRIKNIKVGRFFSAKATYASVAVALGLGLSVFPILKIVDQQVNGATYKEQVDARIQIQKDEYEARRFRPPQVDEWQENYVDLVIYLEGFVELYNRDEYTKSLNRELMNYMFTTYRVEEEKTILAVAKIFSLVNELDQKLQSIHPDFVDENIEKMRELEQTTLNDVEKILGSRVRVEALFKAEKRHFEQNRKTRLAN